MRLTKYRIIAVKVEFGYISTSGFGEEIGGIGCMVNHIYFTVITVDKTTVSRMIEQFIGLFTENAQGTFIPAVFVRRVITN